MDFAYYFLAAGTHPATEADSTLPGWSKEFTSHNEMAEYVTEKSNFPIIFAAQTQGLAVDDVVAQTIGRKQKSRSKSGKVKKANPGDEVKGNLARLLRTCLGKS